ncbi:diguanylate cyclase domain-containing protein [Deinococcus sp. QL22]|uniref:diguanylate cyclase domain-containing protein n=1 Tax=Deinococcus sp. QL22 TaxID=2939437 RepID=UPI002018101C|nr:GGDEF domain-containing protein [Deinococcus sp. QL22]
MVAGQRFSSGQPDGGFIHRCERKHSNPAGHAARTGTRSADGPSEPRSLHPQLQKALGQLHTHDTAFAVGFVDLDGFKAVDDALGYAAGDILPQEVARRLSRIVRSGDVVARLVGDEFMVLWRGISSPTQAGVLGERLVAACAPPYEERSG